MPKVIHLLKRRGGLPIGDFQDRIYEAAQRMVPPQGCRRFVQSHTLRQGYRKGELLFDALEEYWFDDDQDAAAFASRPPGGSFSSELLDVASCHAMVADEVPVKALDVPRGAIKNIEFVNRRPGMPLEAFQDYWTRVHGPLGAQIPSILCYVQNHSASSEYQGQDPTYDGLAITWFSSTDAMRAGAATDIYRITREDEANFLPDGHLPVILTTEVIDTGWI